jgi:hypothetical protein
MQAQRTLTNFCFQIFAVLRTRFAQFVILGSVLLLVALVIALELHLVGHAHITTSAARQIAEGPVDCPMG